MANYIHGVEVASNDAAHRQVWQATHAGDGESRLPLMNRSFISFIYGGKAIEDFDLIATTQNNRLERAGYSNFNDLTTTYENLDGQQYWNTHYTTNSLIFKLATDGIEQKKLEEFLSWFQAGVSRELILAEHPNRAQYARVSEPPQLSLLPFEHQTSMKIGSITYPITTTLYKGEITLTLVMDDPHWYAINNLLGKVTSQGYSSVWKDPTDENSENVRIFSSPDAMKILYEDNIPLGEMIQSDMILGNNIYAKIDNQDYNKLWSLKEEDIIYINNEPSGVGARIEGTKNGITYMARIAGPIMTRISNSNPIPMIPANTSRYFYYAGNAPAPTKISFKLYPEINSSSYIITPQNETNSIVHAPDGTQIPYNSITIKSFSEQVLKFTTPNIFTSYNYAIDIISNIEAGVTSWEEIYNSIRDKVRHPAVRAWAAKILDYYKGNTNNTATVSTNDTNSILNAMPYFLKDKTQSYNILPVTFVFDSKTGEALGTFKYRSPSGTLGAGDPAFSTYGSIRTVTENVGDMLHSNYIIIKDRNYPNENGHIIARNTLSNAGYGYSHEFTHDVNSGLYNLSIEYKNMYL